jgi:uncharacterized protein (TIGR00251 family)
VGAAGSTRLKLRVAPGARRPGVVGRHGDAWKVRVAEPPEDGRANDGVVRLLGETLGVAVSVVAGHSSRDKVLSCALDAAEAERLLSEASGKERA